jgi:hypothetical protein
VTLSFVLTCSTLYYSFQEPNYATVLPIAISPSSHVSGNPGHHAVVPAPLPSHHPRLRPIIEKAEVDRMVNDLKKLLEEAGSEALTKKNIVFSQRNFAMAVVGLKGNYLPHKNCRYPKAFLHLLE